MIEKKKVMKNMTTTYVWSEESYEYFGLGLV